jgi:hypothetical protein
MVLRLLKTLDLSHSDLPAGLPAEGGQAGKYRSEIFVPGRQDNAFPEGIPSERAQQSRQLERDLFVGHPAGLDVT